MSLPPSNPSPMKRVVTIDKVTLLEEIKRGTFKLKKPEETKEKIAVKVKDENKTFVKFINLGPTP